MAASKDTVCCMCGDIGFSDKLFQCSHCQFRHQHSYCTNYYSQKAAGDAAEVCDWCLSEERSNNSKLGVSQCKKLVISTEKIKQIKVDREDHNTVCRGKSITPGGSSSSSSKASGRGISCSRMFCADD